MQSLACRITGMLQNNTSISLQEPHPSSFGCKFLLLFPERCYRAVPLRMIVHRWNSWGRAQSAAPQHIPQTSDRAHIHPRTPPYSAYVQYRCETPECYMCLSITSADVQMLYLMRGKRVLLMSAVRRTPRDTLCHMRLALQGYEAATRVLRNHRGRILPQ